MLLAALARRVAENGDETAVISPGTRLTYRELGEAVSYTAERLAGAGIGPHDTVGVTVAGEVDHLIVALALIRTGCVQVALPSHEPQHHRRTIATRTGCSVVVATDATAALDTISLLAPEFGRSPADALAGPHPTDRVCLLATSSGTTGRAKFIPLTQRHLGEQARTWQWPPSRDVFLRPTSIEFNNSRRQRLYNIVHATTNVFVDRSDRDWFEMCHEHRVTRLAVSSMQARRLADRVNGDGVRLPENCHVRIGGSDMPAPLRRAFIETVTPLLHVTYATSEFGSIATAGPAHNRDKPESVGLVHDGVQVEIVDDDDKVLTPNVIGRIRARSPGMVHTYFDDVPASEGAFRNGWFYPGDMGAFDDHGVLSISGRADDMMNLASINIFPAEIENTVSEHPDVMECAAFALKSRDLGDIPLVAVVARRDIDARALLTFARERLGVRAPRRVVFVESLPCNAGAKIDREALRARFAPGGHAREGGAKS